MLCSKTKEKVEEELQRWRKTMEKKKKKVSRNKKDSTSSQIEKAGQQFTDKT